MIINLYLFINIFKLIMDLEVFNCINILKQDISANILNKKPKYLKLFPLYKYLKWQEEFNTKSEFNVL